jgi:hypothetical protein
MTAFPVTPESLARETLQAVSLLQELDELTPNCVPIRRSYLGQIEAKLQRLLTLVTAPPPPVVVQDMRPLVRALDAELDRLGWTSATAPRGPCCLDVFATNEAGIVAVEHPTGSTCFSGTALLAILEQLTDDINYGDLWQAMQPAMVQE